MKAPLTQSKTKIRPWKTLFLAIIFAVVLLFLTLLGYRVITGRSLGLRSWVSNSLRSIPNILRAGLDEQVRVNKKPGEYKDIIFLHHSTGNNLILQGGVREKMTQAGYNFWDHGYNADGLRDPSGSLVDYHFMVPGDNTDPDGLANIFNQTVFPLPVNTLTMLLQYDVIVVKSCFAPANHFTSDEQLEKYKDWYLGMRNTMGHHPEKFFVLMTSPPLNPAETNNFEAYRAREYAKWLSSDEFLNGSSNLVVFDLFDLLAEDDPTSPEYNMLRTEYRNGTDSHPNQLANETIAPIFVKFVDESIQRFRRAQADSE